MSTFLRPGVTMTTHFLRSPQRLRTKSSGPLIHIWCSREEESGQDGVSSDPHDVTCTACVAAMEATLRVLSDWDKTRATSPGTIKGE